MPVGRRAESDHTAGRQRLGQPAVKSDGHSRTRQIADVQRRKRAYFGLASAARFGGSCTL